MNKKKVSGQTVAILVLAILLLVTVVFGGVFAFYSARSNQVSGKIVMANLKISLESQDSGSTDRSEIVISNGTNVVPGQPLENSPLVIKNLSSVNIYLVVVYEINATRENGEKVLDEHKAPLLGLSMEYINSIDTTKNVSEYVTNSNWVDYVFKGEEENKIYRCLVSMVDFAPSNETNNGIEVIGKDRLALSGAMGNEYQQTSISFTFQAYAIGSNSGFTFNAENKAEKCEQIVRAIYSSQGHTFLNINVNN